MRDIQILQQTLQNQCPNIHKKRLNSLILDAKTILDGTEFTLIKLGRALGTKTTVKNAIKGITVCYPYRGLVEKYRTIEGIKSVRGSVST